MADSTPKFCRDCANLRTSLCIRNTPRDGIDLVTGEPLGPLAYSFDAHFERSKEFAEHDPPIQLCGPSGRYFEAVR